MLSLKQKIDQKSVSWCLGSILVGIAMPKSAALLQLYLNYSVSYLNYSVDFLLTA